MSSVSGSRGARGARKAAGIAAIVLCSLAAIFALGVSALDVGVYGLAGLLLAGGALALAIELVSRGRGPLALATAAVGVPVAVAAVVGGAGIGERLACSDGERQALARIEHVGGARPSIAGDLQSTGCIVRYTAPIDAAAAVDHYRAALAATGWKLDPRADPATGCLQATRANLHAWVSWWPAEHSATRVVVSVND